MPKLPGEAIAKRPLHFIWILDCSSSMDYGEKIQKLNQAIRETIPHMQSVASENPTANVLVRVLKFANGAQWQIATPTPVNDFRWEDLYADGLTDMGKALSLVADQLKIPPMEERALPPVLVLVSDGQPTDDFSAGLKKLLDEPWGRKAVRIAIAIGNDADMECLQKFIGHNEIKPLLANNAELLVRYIKWASTVVLKAASSPMSMQTDSPESLSSVPIPVLPDGTDDGFDDDDW